MPDTLSAADDATPAIANENRAAATYVTLMAPSDDWDGALILRKQDTRTPDATPEDVALGITLASKYVVVVPEGWSFQYVADTVDAGSVYVYSVPYGDGFKAEGPAIFPIESVFAASEAKIAAALVDLDAVITDLEGDTGGDSVAQAITDLGGVVTDLEA
jgi:hypothetical protein